MLIKRNLDMSAENYVMDILNYENVLCSCTREALGLRKGYMSTYAFMPSSRTLDGMGNFREGGVFKKSASYLPKYLLDNYGKKKKALFVFDDVMANPADSYITAEGPNVKSIKDDIYHIYSSECTDPKTLEKTIWATAVSWHFVCVVLAFDDQLINNQLTATSLCNSIKSNIFEVVVGAFDGEGFIHSQLR